MNNLDEGFFKNKYESYKDKVLSILSKHFGINLPKDLHAAEDWIRDYFVDKFSAFDCADSMRTHFRQYGVAENMKMDIKTAKQILKENNYHFAPRVKTFNFSVVQSSFCCIHYTSACNMQVTPDSTA